MKDILKAIVISVVLDALNKAIGGDMIERFAIYLWQKFSFEIISLLVGFFIVISLRIYSVHREFQSIKGWIGHPKTALNLEKDKDKYNLISLIDNQIEYRTKDLRIKLDKILEMLEKK